MAHGLTDQHDLIKSSRIGSICGSPQEMSSFFDAGYVPESWEKVVASDEEYFES